MQMISKFIAVLGQLPPAVKSKGNTQTEKRVTLIMQTYLNCLGGFLVILLFCLRHGKYISSCLRKRHFIKAREREIAVAIRVTNFGLNGLHLDAF